MLSEVKSKIYNLVKRPIKVTLLRFGINLQRVRPASVQGRAGAQNSTQGRAREQLGADRKQLAVDRRRLAEERKQLKVDKKRLAKDRERLRLAGWRKPHLRKPGFSPRTIFDIGAANGTPALYKAFPEAFHVLIEPLKENEPHLQKILQEYNGDYFLTAVGARDEELTINVEANKRRSSIYSRTNLSPTDPVEKRKIPVTTLDALAEKHDFEPPFGLKIDTEGFEYQVVEGASSFLRKTQFVIAELSVEKLYEGSYSFAEFVGLMDEHGFYLCDVLYLQYDLQSETELLHMDAMFRKED